jgi:hypothetical protein
MGLASNDVDAVSDEHEGGQHKQTSDDFKRGIDFREKVFQVLYVINYKIVLGFWFTEW